MKKLILIFSFLALAAVQANAQEITLDAVNSPDEDFLTISGESYVATPASGAWNETGNVSGCNGSGAGCTEGFEFSYTVDTGSNIDIVTDKFETPELAFNNAQGIIFSSIFNSVTFFLPCGGCASAIGIITLNVVLGDAFPAIPDVSLPDNSFTFTADDLVSTAFEPTQNQDLNVGAFINSYTDTDAANLAFIETAKAIGEILAEGGDSAVLDMLLLEGQAASEKLTAKVMEFRVTDEGAALNLVRLEAERVIQEYGEAAQIFREDGRGYLEPTQELRDAVQARDEVRAAETEYAAVEFQQFVAAHVTAGEYRLEQEQIAESVGLAAAEAEAQQISAAWDQGDEQYRQGQIQRDIDAALGFQNQSDMNDGIDSVIGELTGIIVLSQAGPIKTYAAAGDAAIITVAALDAGR